MTDSEKLLKLAEWFDVYDAEMGNIGANEVQKSLREIAERIKHHPSEPAETGGAEEVWNIAEGILDKCRCEPIYANRKMVDPNCAWCEYHVDFIQAMTTYAAQRCAEKDREIELRKIQIEELIELSMSERKLHSELSEANKRIESIDAHRSRLIESVKKWGGAWRKCRAELKEARKEMEEYKNKYIGLREMNEGQF